MCEKQLIDFFVFDFITNQDQSQEMCNSIICADPFSLTYVPNQYKTKQMYDKAVDDCLAPLKLISD